ncbi:MAG TPA: hypothetical protein VF615_25265 [Longimicrobiaceae bacterium]|jgi:hypothetical protein
MTPSDNDPPAGDGGESPPIRTIEHQPPGGGCGCGPTGCLTALVMLFVVLLAVMVGIAVLRPWPRGMPMM